MLLQYQLLPQFIIMNHGICAIIIIVAFSLKWFMLKYNHVYFEMYIYILYENSMKMQCCTGFSSVNSEHQIFILFDAF